MKKFWDSFVLDDDDDGDGDEEDDAWREELDDVEVLPHALARQEDVAHEQPHEGHNGQERVKAGLEVDESSVVGSGSRVVRLADASLELELLPLQVGLHHEEGGQVEWVKDQVDSGLQET